MSLIFIGNYKNNEDYYQIKEGLLEIGCFCNEEGDIFYKPKDQRDIFEFLKKVVLLFQKEVLQNGKKNLH